MLCRSISFNFFRANTEAIGQDFQRFCVRFRNFVAFEAGDFLGGNRCRVTSVVGIFYRVFTILDRRPGVWFGVLVPLVALITERGS
jgi:hypothetical protein